MGTAMTKFGKEGVIIASFVTAVVGLIFIEERIGAEILGQSLLVVGGYIFTIATSGIVFKHFVGELEHEEKGSPQKQTPAGFPTGIIIGKCENILVLSLILLGGYVGLAVIFVAKPIARADEFKHHPEYYLAGTLLNFTYSVVIGVLLHVALNF